MNGFERKLQILDLTVSIILFVVGCIIGKLVMNVYDPWWAFNALTIGTVAIGELIWWKVRKAIIMESEKRSKGD